MSREAQLLARIADLEEENRYLREALAPVDTLPRSWRLSAAQTRLVVSLAKAKGCIGRERLRLAIGNISRDVTDGTLEIDLFRARRALARYGVEIQAVRQVGLIMPPESRRVVLDTLAAVAAGQVA